MRITPYGTSAFKPLYFEVIQNHSFRRRLTRKLSAHFPLCTVFTIPTIFYSLNLYKPLLENISINPFTSPSLHIPRHLSATFCFVRAPIHPHWSFLPFNAISLLSSALPFTLLFYHTPTRHPIVILTLSSYSPHTTRSSIYNRSRNLHFLPSS